MLIKRMSLVMSMSLASLFATTVPAFGDDGWGHTDCSQLPAPGCELSAGTGHQNGQRQPGSGTDNPGNVSPDERDAPRSGNENLARCGYQPSDYRPPTGRAGSGVFADGVWLDGLCSATGVFDTPVFVPEVTPAEVAQLAKSQLRLPAPGIAANPPADQLVHLPTWLLVGDGWREVSATASVPGVSVTAMAQPASVTWSMGDGGTVTCQGPGKPFPAGTDPTSASPDCGYTYRSSSAAQPDEVYPVTATIHWTVTWSGAGASGTFPNMTTTSTMAFRVVEAQALNTGSASERSNRVTG